MEGTEELRGGMEDIPGWEGSIGPGPSQYHLPHVYARDVHSGAGNCVCGRDLPSPIHVAAAPGVPIPEHMRVLRKDTTIELPTAGFGTVAPLDPG